MNKALRLGMALALVFGLGSCGPAVHELLYFGKHRTHPAPPHPAHQQAETV